MKEGNETDAKLKPQRLKDHNRQKARRRTMGWLTGWMHKTSGDDDYREKLGATHTDTYHTDSNGKRDRPHSEDLKVSGSKHEPSMTDVHSSKK